MGMTRKKVTARSSDTVELEAALGERIAPVIAQLLRTINIDQVRAESGTLRDLDVAKVVLGEASIDRIVLTGTSAKLKGAQAFMQSVRMVLELRFTLEWEVDLGWLGSWDGSENLGSLPFGMNLGNINVPSLADIDFSIPTLSVEDVKAKVEPINGLDLGGAQIKKVMAKDTDIPADGFGVSGLGIGSASMKNLSVPKTSTASASIEEFQPNSEVELPGIELSDLELPAARVDNVKTGGFNFLAQASARSIGADLGILAIKLIVEPMVHLDVGSMTIQDVELSAMAKKLKVQDIHVPVTLRGITMNDLALQAVKIGEVSL